MTYNEAIEFLMSHLPMFHQVGISAYNGNLDKALALDAHFGHPHKKFKTIHVAGTNGKGSVSHMLAAVLQSAGYKVGLYTSPHVLDFRERIRVNGEVISEEAIRYFIEQSQSLIEELKPSFFEMTMALAFNYFAQEQVDIAVVEVGLGGRLDATNIITPLVSVITNISFDHMDILGNTRELIAREKAGIIKKNIPVVVGQSHLETDMVFKSIAEENTSPLYFADRHYSLQVTERTDSFQSVDIFKGGECVYKNIVLDLPGVYQEKNVITAIQTLGLLEKILDVSLHDAVYNGLKNVKVLTGLMGRWQVLRYEPLVVCETAHNADGISEMVRHVKTLSFQKLHIVIGFVKDKDYIHILALLPAEAEYYYTRATVPRAADEHDLAGHAARLGLKGNTYSDVKKAYDAALQNASKQDMIIICGSIFLVADLLRRVKAT